MEFYTYPIRSDELYHFGVKGMHWGVRRYQNPDGTLTLKGKDHYHSRVTNKIGRQQGANSSSHKASQKLDKKISDYVAKESRGKSVAKNLIFGVQGKMTYDMARSIGESRGKAAVRALLDINLSRAVSATAYTVAGRNTAGISKNRTTASIAARAASDVTGRITRNSGLELSLQQRAIRRKYVKKNRG